MDDAARAGTRIKLVSTLKFSREGGNALDCAGQAE
jgi:hypothetical protein